MIPPRKTSVTRRGFGLVLAALLEDTTEGLHSPQHPSRRRLKTAEQRLAWDAAVKWLSHESNEQADRDDAKDDAALQERMSRMVPAPPPDKPEPDYGGVFDGNQVISDADPGL